MIASVFGAPQHIGGGHGMLCLSFSFKWTFDKLTWLRGKDFYCPSLAILVSQIVSGFVAFVFTAFKPIAVNYAVAESLGQDLCPIMVYS